MPRVIVRLHARAAELAGSRECDVLVDGDASGADVKAALARRVPALSGLLESCVLASDAEFLRDDAVVGGLEALHLIPPVSGG